MGKWNIVLILYNYLFKPYYLIPYDVNNVKKNVIQIEGYDRRTN